MGEDRKNQPPQDVSTTPRQHGTPARTSTPERYVLLEHEREHEHNGSTQRTGSQRDARKGQRGERNSGGSS